MKKHLIMLVTAITLIAIVGALVFTGCAEEEAPPPPPPPPVKPEPKPEPEPEPPWEWPEKLVITTSALGGAVYATFAAWTAVLQEQTGMMVRIVPEDNEALRSKMVKNGNAFMRGISGGGRTVYEAQEAYATRDGGPFLMGMVWTLTKGSFSFMVRGDSPIRTIYDVKPGVKIPHMPGVPGMLEAYESFLAWAGLTLDDAVLVPFGSFSALIRSIPDGKADVGFIPGLSHAATYEAEAAPHGLRWIELNPNEDPEGALRFWSVTPDRQFAVITEGVPSVQGTWGCLVVSPMAVRFDADEELVYHLTKWLHESWDSYKDKYRYCETSMTLEAMRTYLDSTIDPVHPGTIRYLKEIGQWTEADELRQEYNVNLVNRYIQAFQEAIKIADEKELWVNPANEEWLELWENYKKDIGIPKVRVMTDAQIKEALGK